jgi:exopolysaccharide biosynthesis polyprenyl glycosylphosphotransferase
MERYDVQHVIVAFSGARHDVLLPMVRQCWILGVPVSLVPRLFEAEGVRVTTEHIGDLPLVGVHPSDPAGWQFRVKYAVDRAISAVLLAAMLPLLAAIAIAVRVTSGPNVLYRQRRVGRDGRAFDMLKFRTMRDVGSEHGEADADWAAAQTSGFVPGSSLSEQERYTSLGRLLRRSALDELPQLWNVLRGDMSLVGPRPERLSYSTLFESDIYRYGDRHRVKSGLTGWAQVNGLRGKTSLADRIEWDNHYIENWSLWLDFKIVMRTMGVVFRGGGQA